MMGATDGFRKIYSQRKFSLKKRLWSHGYDMDFGPMVMVLKDCIWAWMHVSPCYHIEWCKEVQRECLKYYSWFYLLLDTHDSLAHFPLVILVGPCGSYLFASFQVRVRQKRWASQVKLEPWGRSVYKVIPIGNSLGGVLRCVILNDILFMFKVVPMRGYGEIPEILDSKYLRKQDISKIMKALR